MAKAIAPAVTHTESVGGADRVYERGYFDTVSDGTASVSITKLVSVANSNTGLSGGGIAVVSAVPFPPRFMTAGGKRQLAFKTGTTLVKPNGTTFSAPATVDVDFNPGPYEDGQYDPDNPGPAAGMNYRVYVDNNGAFRVLSVDADLSGDPLALIGGFQTLCVDAGNLTYAEYTAAYTVYEPHPLSEYVAGDILPASVWCLNHRPYSNPNGMVFIDSLGFWCDIYLTSGYRDISSAYNAGSVYQATVTRSREISRYVEDLAFVGKELLSDAEFTAAALGSPTGTNVAGSSQGNLRAGGRTDTTGVRMISIYGVEEMCGYMWQFLRDFARNAEGMTDWAAAATDFSRGKLREAGAVIAGGSWSDGSVCGPWSRSAVNARTFKDTKIGARGMSRHTTA